MQVFDLQDIKKTPIIESELNFLKEKVGSYEKLFNKRSQLYKERGLKNQVLTENDYKNLILEHYTFLVRPVVVIDNQVFTGSSPEKIQRIKTLIQL